MFAIRKYDIVLNLEYIKSNFSQKLGPKARVVDTKCLQSALRKQVKRDSNKNTLPFAVQICKKKLDDKQVLCSICLQLA